MGIQKGKQKSWETKHRVDRWNWSVCRSRVEDTNNYGEESGLVMAVVDNADDSFLLLCTLQFCILICFIFRFR